MGHLHVEPVVIPRMAFHRRESPAPAQASYNNVMEVGRSDAHSRCGVDVTHAYLAYSPYLLLHGRSPSVHVG